MLIEELQHVLVFNRTLQILAVADCCSFSQNSALEWGLFLRGSTVSLLNWCRGLLLLLSVFGVAGEVSSLLPHQLCRVIFLHLIKLRARSQEHESLPFLGDLRAQIVLQHPQ